MYTEYEWLETRKRTMRANEALSKTDQSFCFSLKSKIILQARGNPLPTYNVHSSLPLHMISVRNKAIRPMVYYPHFNNLSFLDETEIPFAFLIMYQAGRKNNKANNYSMNGVTQSLFPDAERALNMLWALDFLRVDTAQNIVDASTGEELVKLLLEAGYEAPKTKLSKMQSVLDRIDEQTIHAKLAHNERFFPSSLGYCIIQSLYYEMGSIYISEVEALRKEMGIDEVIMDKQFLLDCEHSYST